MVLKILETTRKENKLIELRIKLKEHKDRLESLGEGEFHFLPSHAENNVRDWTEVEIRKIESEIKKLES